MKIIKLNAIDSTNSFLKKLAQDSTQENGTIVLANEQLSGRGQMTTSWVSEPFKNLTFSFLFYFDRLLVSQQKYLNFATSLAVYQVLLEEGIPNLSIKWPNDILSANKKLCGILIENILKGSKISYSVIGIGLNVNQTEFPSSIGKVTSLKLLMGKEYELPSILEKISFRLNSLLSSLSKDTFEVLEKNYLNSLYKKNTTTMFKDNNGKLFMGIIRGISTTGKLQIEVANSEILEFQIKEISFL
ncbi:biotin--[acetyl-CoA-carboxylase] ligase [Polaribacter tangerinus]|uniref:biotin--[acetyl-CoA-carboxylase] ligase n=1 Tax=Polaribacter tangerinus TaxID=1920034 RepID=UPI000B4AB9C5|nr:biotin--[acetyl-CoA-carboxylase] ligase [Polaribacter tangerinus]